MLSFDLGGIDPLDGSGLGSGVNGLCVNILFLFSLFFFKGEKGKNMDTRLYYNIKRHLHKPIKAFNVPKLFPSCSLPADNDMREEIARDVWELGIVALRE